MMGVRVGIAATTAVVSQMTRHESADACRATTQRLEAGGRPTLRVRVGVLLLQISGCRPSKHYMYVCNIY